VVTVCHSAAPDITVYTQTADILIAAIGRPDYITAEMLRPNTVVIDVGINRVADDSTTKGYRVTGDVDFQSVSKICSHITPVPGGVGVLTIAMLLKNTLESYKRREGNV
jgi:methylenetetrahydrofolate dehydrogenase (NADP+)/methenyltetrahydrofolate cyclohydrolase